jgi:hypothetical protein
VRDHLVEEAWVLPAAVPTQLVCQAAVRVRALHGGQARDGSLGFWVDRSGWRVAQLGGEGEEGGGDVVRWDGGGAAGRGCCCGRLVVVLLPSLLLFFSSSFFFWFIARPFLARAWRFCCLGCCWRCCLCCRPRCRRRERRAVVPLVIAAAAVAAVGPEQPA